MGPQRGLLNYFPGPPFSLNVTKWSSLYRKIFDDKKSHTKFNKFLKSTTFFLNRGPKFFFPGLKNSSIRLCRRWGRDEGYHFSRSRVDFINVFTRSFYVRRSQKRKKLLDLTVFFVLLGSERVKAARKMLVKLTPRLWHSRWPSCPFVFNENFTTDNTKALLPFPFRSIF